MTDVSGEPVLLAHTRIGSYSHEMFPEEPRYQLCDASSGDREERPTTRAPSLQTDIDIELIKCEFVILIYVCLTKQRLPSSMFVYVYMWYVGYVYRGYVYMGYVYMGYAKNHSVYNPVVTPWITPMLLQYAMYF